MAKKKEILWDNEMQRLVVEGKDRGNIETRDVKYVDIVPQSSEMRALVERINNAYVAVLFHFSVIIIYRCSPPSTTCSGKHGGRGYHLGSAVYRVYDALEEKTIHLVIFLFLLV